MAIIQNVGQKMGEVKRKSRTREAILATEPRCIYCPGLPQTLEHMPSLGMLRGKQRPSGMEYAACTTCNNGTRGSDAVAAVMARLHPDNGESSWQAEEMRKLMSALDSYAPGVREELSKPDKARSEWLRRPGSGLLQRVVRVHADGPKLKAYLSVYGAKLAMALYREHVGTALPLDGAIWCQFSLNAGMTQEHLNERVKILPVQETLRQGRKNVADQFAYRYNSDGRSVVAAVAQFHRGLWFTIFASCDPRIVELFTKPEFLSPSGQRPDQARRDASTSAVICSWPLTNPEGVTMVDRMTDLLQQYDDLVIAVADSTYKFYQLVGRDGEAYSANSCHVCGSAQYASLLRPAALQRDCSLFKTIIGT